jgi:hypothetical protein
MAEGGNAQESSENSAESSESAHLTDMHISTYEEMKADNFIESEGRLSKASQGWLEAIAKDERTERARNRVQDAPRSQRSWQSRRSSYRAREDARRTEQGWQRKIRSHWDKPDTTPPYAKGWVDEWWDRAWIRIFRWLGVS